MKVLGTETRRHSNKTFSLHLVDNLESIYTINVKSGFLKNADAYKKNVFTNGSIEKVFSLKNDTSIKVDFKVHNADWLIMIDEHGKCVMYINEQYCGPVVVKNKYVQEMIDACYEHCKDRIESKREFAKEMGTISRRLNLPFQIVLAFKGNEELLAQMIQNVESAIYNKLYENKYFMEALSGNNQKERMQAIQTLGITNVPEYQSEKIAKYLADCLEKQKVVRRYE